MRIILLVLAMTALLASTTFSQKHRIPILKANSTSVDIRDNGQLKKNAWTISPELRPDVYTTIHKNSTVTFFTDLDSLTFRTKPGKVIDFIILLNGKDTAYTQIAYQEIPTYLEILKKSAKFNNSEKRSIPNFTYQASDTTPLVALRTGFKLDSIAGSGNEISKILNLCHWIHELIPHDGQHENPQVRNAMSMIAVCKNDQRGLNCRGLATVLNECYLSMGFKSRFLTCLPRDSSDTECHVINIVYSEDLQKWIWVDPTHDAYVMDGKGVLLHPGEVREHLIAGKTLILNPTANWNHRSTTTKDNYLDSYMAKNLYRFECPIRSQYDTETRAAGKKIEYVQLLPTEYYFQTPEKTETTNPTSATTFINYKSNSSSWFWAKPK